MRQLSILLLLYPVLGYSQPGLSEMVNAEKAFIEMARTQNRRDAFLHFLSDSAVTQGPGGPVKGKARIAAQPVTDDLLSWEVSYSDIARSGDFGFNTGPWYFRSKKTDEIPAAYGEFNSVWKKTGDGSWKNVLDIGISHGAVPETPVNRTAKGEDSRCNCLRNPSQSTAREAEMTFLKALASQVRVPYLDHLSSNARMMVSGHLPFTGVDGLSAFIAASPVPTNHTVLGSETASSKDMGYVYGIADCRVTKDGKQETRKATYVRIWRVECCKWKIVLDVLTYQP